MIRLAPAALLLPRLIGALSLRARTFAEIGDDPNAGPQAAIVVIVGGFLEATVHAAIHRETAVDSTLVTWSVLAALIGWLLWTGIVWVVAHLFEHPVGFGVVLRAIAFTHASTLVYGLAAIPALTAWEGLVRALSLLWFGAMLFAATRGVLAVGARRALLVLAVAMLGRLAIELAPQALSLVANGSR